MQIVVVVLIIVMIAFAAELYKFYDKGTLEPSQMASHTTVITLLGIISIVILVIDFVQGL